MVHTQIPALMQVPSAHTTIGQTYSLISDKTEGKYPDPSPFRDELRRSLRFASTVWGSDTSWETITDSDWIKLIEQRLEELLRKNTRAVRATEITISRLITAVTWLRKTKRISRDAAQWPTRWKQAVAAHWKAVTGSVRDPTPFQPKHALDDVSRIREASDFDPRFQLLMWFGAERLGQVARTVRSDLDLREGAGEGYGTLTVHGHGNQSGGVVQLTAGQRAAVDRAIEGGYLSEKERTYRADNREDYVLFPTGYTIGRVGLVRGKGGKLSLGNTVDFRRSVTSSWIRKNFRLAEKRAGIPHVIGRSAFGVRRVIRSEGSKSFAERHFHPTIIQHGRKLFIQGNYFHSVFEAAKAYHTEVKRRARSSKDGQALMLDVFSANNGVLRMTAGVSDTDRNVQEGVKFLSAGLMQAIRNPTAHESALDWPIARDDALDILSFISFLFRQLDKADFSPA